MIVIGSNTSDNGQSCFTEDVSHFMELRQNRQLALLKRSAKNRQYLRASYFSETLYPNCLCTFYFHKKIIGWKEYLTFSAMIFLLSASSNKIIIHSFTNSSSEIDLLN